MSSTWQVPAPKSCYSYLPGHNPHWIQVFNHVRSAPRQSAAVTYIADSLFRVETGDQVWEWFNHDPIRLIKALEWAGKYRPEIVVEVASTERLILTPSPRGRFLFYFVEGELADCSLEDGFLRT